MASPYMRSLSFAPHHSHSAWTASSSVNHAAARSQQLFLNHHHHHHQPQSHSINSHNTHIYAHHLHNFNERSSYSIRPYPEQQPIPFMNSTKSPAGRRRSSSIRSRNPPPFIKFDPFADDPADSVSVPSTFPPQSRPPSPCSTIELAAPVQTDVQRYVVRSPPKRYSFANDDSVGNSFGPGHLLSPIRSRAVSPPALSRPPTLLRSSPPPPPPVRQPLLSGPGALGGPEVTKVVANMIFTRMSVGKPLRRRPSLEKKAYVKSSLSSVVSVEA